jgi:hypothetical protein
MRQARLVTHHAMTFKLFEIRDKATTISALAVQVSKADGWIMERAGFGQPMVYLIALATQACRFDPWGWGDRTFHTAHMHIAEHFDELMDGQVVDVEFLLGETTKPKRSERPHDGP